MLTGFVFGMILIECSMVSPISLTAGSTGKIHAPRPIISLSMSFCGVADITSGENPCFSAMAWYIARIMEATALMVRLAPILARSMPSKAISKSRRLSIAIPTLPTSPSAIGSSES
jgi:hypothetical protein